MILVLATRNPGKVAELRARLVGLPVELVPATEVEGAGEVEETADTLHGNAALKSEALHGLTGDAALADDTGLEVDALGGAPGVWSARYAGPEGDAAANRAKLLDALHGSADRRARFRTVLAYTDSEGTRYFEGVCEGTVTAEEYGTGGFGYDAVFRPDEQPVDTNPGQPEGARTFAEMTTEEKNRISHRGRALDSFAAWLARRLEG